MSIEAVREDARKELDKKQRNNLLCRMAGNIMAGMYGNPRTLDFTNPTGINFPGLIPNEELARQAVDLARAIIAEVERG